MGNADLIQKRLQSLSPERQAQVLAYIESLADAAPADSSPGEARRQKLLDAIAAARACLPHKLGLTEIDDAVSQMRSEWDDRGWEASR